MSFPTVDEVALALHNSDFPTVGAWSGWDGVLDSVHDRYLQKARVAARLYEATRIDPADLCTCRHHRAAHGEDGSACNPCGAAPSGEPNCSPFESVVTGLKVAALREAAEPAVCQWARKLIEEHLLWCRDNRLSLFDRHNGLVVYEKDGTESALIRMGFEEGWRRCLNTRAAEMEERG